MNFYTLNVELVKLFVRIRHIMLLIICQFRENRCKEGRTFYMGVSVNRIRVYRGKKIKRERERML